MLDLVVFDACFLSACIEISSFEAWIKEAHFSAGMKVSSLTLNYLIQNTPKSPVLTVYRCKVMPVQIIVTATSSYRHLSLDI